MDSQSRQRRELSEEPRGYEIDRVVRQRPRNIIHVDGIESV